MNDLFDELKKRKTLFSIIENDEFRAILVYLITRKEHHYLKAAYFNKAIEIWNDEVKIVILFSIGIENRHYLDMKNNQNLHFITFSAIYEDKSVFKDIYIKIINIKEWLSLIHI
jgi:Mn-containing catalase